MSLLKNKFVTAVLVGIAVHYTVKMLDKKVINKGSVDSVDGSEI